jgi:uncharacterized membrane protein
MGQSITLDYADPRAAAGDETTSAQAFDSQPPSRDYGRSDHTPAVANALGWFSIGLGLAELTAPGLLTRSIGVPGDHRRFVRLLGLREIASGVGILTQRRSAAWVRSRVWGDMMDLAALGAAFTIPRTERSKLFTATAAVAGVTLLDLWCSRELQDEESISGPIRITKVVTVNRPPEDLYRFWRDFQNLPSVMSHLESVQVMDETRSHWTANAAAGMTIEWDAEIVDDQPGKRIAWRSPDGAALSNSGTIEFKRAAGDRGTVVRVELTYDPPAGRLGSIIATLLGKDPDQQLQEGLRRFKQRMEAGEIATTDGQSAGRTGLAALAASSS